MAVQTFAVLCAAGIIRLTADESAGYLILWAAFSGLAAAFVLKILIDNGSAPIRENFAFKKQKTYDDLITVVAAKLGVWRGTENSSNFLKDSVTNTSLLSTSQMLFLKCL